MATAAKLSAQPREERRKGAMRKLRSAGRVPAVIYGHGEETRALSVDAHELERLFSHIHRDNTVINLQIDGEKADVKALVREVQAHPYRGTILHVDFYQ
ncbi:MAG: 50S ribosomal protein L25, partial [Longimicrobiales bacterium]